MLHFYSLQSKFWFLTFPWFCIVFLPEDYFQKFWNSEIEPLKLIGSRTVLKQMDQVEKVDQFHFSGTVLTCQFQPCILSTYIFDEIRNKCCRFCWNNNFTVTKIHRDFNRVLVINLGFKLDGPLNGRPQETGQKWTVFLIYFRLTVYFVHDRPL